MGSKDMRRMEGKAAGSGRRGTLGGPQAAGAVKGSERGPPLCRGRDKGLDLAVGTVTADMRGPLRKLEEVNRPHSTTGSCGWGRRRGVRDQVGGGARAGMGTNGRQGFGALL